MSNIKPTNKKNTKIKSRNSFEQKIANNLEIDTKLEANNENINKENANVESNINESIIDKKNHNLENDKEPKAEANNDTPINKDEKQATDKNNNESNNQKDITQDMADNKISEQAKYEIEKLKTLYSNSQLECNKLRLALENERRQLITKLEEKSKAAQVQIEQKLSHLELTKQEEIEKIKENISSDIIIAFIDPILLFESSIQNSPKDNPTISAYLQGYTMIINMFKDKLDSLGVQQIDVRIGDEFNEKFMSAFDVEEASGIEPNKVIRIVGKGFVLNKKIIKYVSVVVSK